MMACNCIGGNPCPCERGRMLRTTRKRFWLHARRSLTPCSKVYDRANRGATTNAHSNHHPAVVVPPLVARVDLHGPDSGVVVRKEVIGNATLYLGGIP